MDLVIQQAKLIRNNNELMDREVPIIITNKFNRRRQVLFRVGEHNEKGQNQSVEESANSVAIAGHKRNNTVCKKQKPIIYTRARRISSSAASKRFPKDFFRSQNCNQTLQKAQSAKKQRVVNMLDTFSQKYIPIHMQEPSKHSTLCKNELTPQFRSKKQYENSRKEYLNSQRNDRRYEQLPKLQKYYSSKEETSQLDLSKVSKMCVKNEDVGRQLKQITPEFSNFNLTLGQKINMALFLKKDKDRKRITKLREKQNRINLPLVLNGVTLRKGEQLRLPCNKI